MLNKEDILGLAWEYSEGGGNRYIFTEESLFEFLKELKNETALAQDELESFKRWAEVEYNVNPNTEELNLSHIEVKASLKGWQARATRHAQKVNNIDTPEQRPMPSKQVPVIPAQWEKSLSHCWPKYLDDKDGDWCVGTVDEDGRLYEVLLAEASQYDAAGESQKIAEAIVELWAFAADLSAQGRPANK